VDVEMSEVIAGDVHARVNRTGRADAEAGDMPAPGWPTPAVRPTLGKCTTRLPIT
jgi:hypothetical protein